MNRTLDFEFCTRATTQFLLLVGVSQWNKMQTFTKLTFLLLMINAIALKIYESNGASKGDKIITGLHYKRQENENSILTNSITTCIRVSWKRLGKRDTVPLIIIPSSSKTYFLDIDVGYPDSYVYYFDFQQFSNSKIWKLYTWQHICFSYSKKNSQIRFVMVSSTNCITASTNHCTFFSISTHF